MSKQMTNTTSRFNRQFLLVELVASTIPDRLTSDVLAEHAKVVPHIKSQRPLPLGSATSVGDSGARHRAPSGGRGEGRIGWGWLRVGVAIGFNGVIFIVGNKATVTKIIIDGSRTDHEVRQVRCGGADEVLGQIGQR
jgi:hypothetical protein